MSINFNNECNFNIYFNIIILIFFNKSMKKSDDLHYIYIEGIAMKLSYKLINYEFYRK